MEINEYISKLTSELSEKLQLASEKLLVQDIIMIYKGKFRSYQEYVETMKSGNDRIDEFDKRVNCNTCITFYAKHNIISLDLYNFIISLRILYKEEK